MKTASKKFRHTFLVLDPSEAECLLSIGFLGTHKCDPMFSEKKKRLNRDTSLNLFHRTAPVQPRYNPVTRIVARETSFILFGHEAIILGIIDIDYTLLTKEAIFALHNLSATNKTSWLSKLFPNFKRMPYQHVSSTQKIERSTKVQHWEHLPSCNATRWPRTL